MDKPRRIEFEFAGFEEGESYVYWELYAKELEKYIIRKELTLINKSNMEQSKWIKVEDKLPEIEKNNTRNNMPCPVILEDGTMTIASFSKTKFKNGVEWVSIDYSPMWICREYGSDLKNRVVFIKLWLDVQPPKED